eukprot:scaffold116126_cov25-Prasinocladus_malaysianus.AAC.1
MPQLRGQRLHARVRARTSTRLRPVRGASYSDSYALYSCLHALLVRVRDPDDTPIRRSRRGKSSMIDDRYEYEYGPPTVCTSSDGPRVAVRYDSQHSLVVAHLIGTSRVPETMPTSLESLKFWSFGTQKPGTRKGVV